MAKPTKAEDKPAPVSTNLMTRWQEDVDRMERLFDDFWSARAPRLFEMPRLFDRGDRVRIPAVDVYEEGDNIIVKAEIPGMTKDDIEVDLNDGQLTISGKKERKEVAKEEQYYRCERSYGSFSRTVELPADVQSSKANATFTDGVLEICLPKTPEAKKKAVKLKIK